MLETMRNAWRVPEIRKKLLYTLVMLLLFRLLSMIPTPGTMDITALMGGTNNGLLDLMSMMNGGVLSQGSIMAMGISPYINASIIMQLLTVAIPALERLSKDGGEEGKKKINRITRYVTVALAVVQAIGIISMLDNNYGMIAEGYNTFWGKMLIGFCMAAGTALAMWIGERITKNGIGNGVSLLIFAGIIANLFTGYQQSIKAAFTPGQFGQNIWGLLVLIAITLLFIVVVTFVDSAERRIPVQYAKRVVGRKLYGGQNTYIPMKVLSVGVLPLIFAYSFMAFPTTIVGLIGGANSSAYKWCQEYLSQGAWPYIVICALLIIAFAYFYTAITFNPQDIAKNVQQQGGHIQGIRPGQATVNFLQKTSTRLTLFAGIFLAILATIPSAIPRSLISIPFGASSIMIAVSVALETVRGVEAQLVMRNYKGFL